MRGNYHKKYQKEPLLKIGSKTENLLYSEKNTNPDLNFFNKQLSEEEYLSHQRKAYQKEEFSTLSKNFQDNYMGPPNLAHQRIDVDNVSGKIGQERREKEISKYQNQPSFAKDQVYNTYINNDRERNANKKYYHNIINNTIFGFCDPGMKYPKTSYQSNFRGNDINEQLKYLSKKQYEDYLQFRKEQIELMNKGNLGKNLRELPPRKRTEDINFKEKEKDIKKENRETRDKMIKEEAENLMKEQRMLDQNQVRTFNPNGYIPTPEEYEFQLKQQKERAINELKKKDGNYNYEIPEQDFNQPDKFQRNNENIRRKTPINQSENNDKEIQNEFYNKNLNNDKNYYQQEIINNNINNNQDIDREKEEYYLKQQQMRKTPINIPYEEQINKNINENYIPSEIKPIENKNKEDYNKYGNEIPRSYEEYQRLIQREAEKENILRQKQENNNNIQMPITKNDENEEEKYREYLRSKAQMEQYSQNYESNEDIINKKKRDEAEEEYLKNVKKYEDIIQDNPEQRFKLPPPPFGSNNLPLMNKISKESQIQGAEPGCINKMNMVSENPYSIDKYNLGETNLRQNPIIHPVNSYQFDYRRLYNPLTNKNN